MKLTFYGFYDLKPKFVFTIQGVKNFVCKPKNKHLFLIHMEIFSK